MGKSSPSPPPAPDPTATAAAQGASNVQTAIAQGYLNRVNQYSPFGSSIYTPTGYTTVDGQNVPTFQQQTTLSPQLQSILNTQQANQQGIGNLASAAIGKIPIGAPDFSGLPNLPTAGQLQNTFDAAAGNAFNAQYGLLAPEFARQDQALDASLAARGIPIPTANNPGASEAYNTARQSVDLNRATQLNALAGQSFGAGLGAEGQLYNQALTGRQQGISEDLTQANLPYQQLAQLMGTSPPVSMPSFPGTPGANVSPTDVLGAYGLQQNALQNAYNTQINQQAGLYGGLGQLAGAGFMGAAAAGWL